MDALEQLLAKQAISELLSTRARASDRGDVELALHCYHEGATERHADFDGLASDFLRDHSFTRVVADSPVTGMTHAVTNILIEFSDDKNAFVESVHVAWCQMTDGVDATIGGRYLDRVAFRDGRWGLMHRDVIFDWSRMDPETAKFWDRHPAAPQLFGKRSPEDMLYAYTERGVPA